MDREYLEKYNSDKEREKIFSDAQKILRDLGLTIEDLLKRNKILDLGASVAAVEKAVRLSGSPDKITSLSLEVPQSVKKSGLNFVKGQASELPFDTGTFDLVISRNGPLYLVEKQSEAEIILAEMLRVQSIKGESRIFPSRLGFIKRQLFDQNPEYFNLHAKPPSSRSKAEIARLAHYNNLANKQTLIYLSKIGMTFETKGNNIHEEEDLDYIVFHK